MADHYFTDAPTAESQPSTIQLELRDLKVTLVVDTGVFSSRKIDAGTQVLLSATIPPRAEGPLLDLGCGYGPIAIALAIRYPDRLIYALDVNERALALCRRNCQALGLDNVRVCKPNEVEWDIRFGGIYSNPPIKVGKKVLHEMLLQWLPRVNKGGATFLVVHKHLGSDSLAKWLSEGDRTVDRITSSRGYRILRIL